jgi:hypothetical protein
VLVSVRAYHVRQHVRIGVALGAGHEMPLPVARRLHGTVWKRLVPALAQFVLELS